MKQSSLDLEPPPAFLGEKEVSKKKDKTLNQLIISLKENKSKNKPQDNSKNTSKKLKTNSQEYTINTGYINSNKEALEERINSTIKSIEFTVNSTESKNQTKSEIKYFQKEINVKNEKDNSQNFYEIASPGYFTEKISQTFIKDENKKENNYYSESKEKEEKGIFYTLHSFDDEKETEESNIKWNARVYN